MYQFKNIKSRLYKTNAAIWYNKTYKHKGLTPNYINVTVSGHNARPKKTRNTAIRHRLNQEIKFLYTKKIYVYLSWTNKEIDNRKLQIYI